jgi:hypothetical protein
MSDINPQQTTRHKSKQFPISAMFDLVRAIMYLTVSGFLFTSNQFDGYLGHGFIKAFAVVSAIYGLFRLVRALISLKIIRIF